MHFGFTFITDEARENLQSLGIIHRRSSSGGWEVFTHSADLTAKENREKPYMTDDVLFGDDKGAIKYQPLKIWRHPDTGFYYYLINGGVFTMYQKRYNDYSTVPPTVLESTVFDWVDDQVPWLDFFGNIPLAIDQYPI